MNARKTSTSGGGFEAETELLDESDRGKTTTGPSDRRARRRTEARAAEGPGPAREGASPLDAETEFIDAPRDRKTRHPKEPDTLPSRTRSGEATPSLDATGVGEAMSDPIAGWLVVVDGPGKGEVCRLGYGANSLGRGSGSRVRVDFGDHEISREAHATVTYDPKGRRFYLVHGGGLNLTYCGDEPVLAPTELKPLQHIVLGKTTLRFVALCGPGFDWQDLD